MQLLTHKTQIPFSKMDYIVQINFRCQNVKTKKFVHKSKTYSGSPAGPKTNRASIIFAAKRNDYERVKILYRYGYRLQKKDSMTDPLKKIELFKVSKPQVNKLK